MIDDKMIKHYFVVNHFVFGFPARPGRVISVDRHASVDSLEFYSRTRFEIGVAIDKLQVEFEFVDTPSVAVFYQLKIVAPDKRSGVLVGLVGQVMKSDTVAERFGLVVVDVDNVVSRLVMNRFQSFQSRVPGLDYLLRRHRRRLASGHGSHVEKNFIREARFHLYPIAIVGVDKQLVYDADNCILFEQNCILFVHNNLLNGKHKPKPSPTSITQSRPDIPSEIFRRNIGTKNT
jgi:hypothetical protein